MWADTIPLRVGRWLVGVRPDSDRTRRRLLELLAAYVVDDAPDSVRDNFSVRAPRLAVRRGPMQLHVAGETVVKASRLEPVVHALASHLSGLAVQTAGCTRVPGRLVVRGDRAVVVGAAWSAPIVPAAPGFSEIWTWRPLVLAEQRVVRVPEYLPDLRWRAAGLDAPSEVRPRQLHLEGLVLPAGPSGVPEIVKFWRGSEGHLDEWGLLLSMLEHRDVIVPALRPEVVPSAVEALLS